MRYLVLFVLLFVFSVATAWCVEPSVDDVIKALETPFSQSTAAARQIHDFQADFFQRSHIASINREQRGSGDVSFKFVSAGEQQETTALFRWTYATPDVQEIISDGRMMWVYLPENRQVIESDISQVRQQGQNPVTFLSNLGNLSKDFAVTAGDPLTDAAGNYRLVLVPHQGSQQFAGMEVVVLKAAVEQYLQGGDLLLFPLVQTTVADGQGNRTAIQFENVRINPGLKTQQFAFETPAGVEVIKPTEQLNIQ